MGGEIRYVRAGIVGISDLIERGVYLVFPISETAIGEFERLGEIFRPTIAAKKRSL